MRIKTLVAGLCALLISIASSTASAQLYTENFDDGNAVNRWTAFPGIGFVDSGGSLVDAPMDTNFDTMPLLGGVDGVNDDFSGFMFDYSTVGIPSAPNSTGGTTIGLKLQASLFSNALGGFSVSPNGVNLTGDYSVKFDAWSSSLGPFPGGGSGSTNLSTFGVQTAGTDSQTLLNADGVFFAYTGDGGSSADYRAYSSDESDSYDGSPAEPDATYFAGTRNGTGQLYIDAVGGDVTVPQSVIDATSQDMSGILNAGAAGFQWHRNEIRVVGDTVDWYMNGFLLISVDTSNFTVPTAGGNLSFGHSDINFSSSTDTDAVDLLFTLIDNIEVTAITASADDADFDGDGTVGGEDFLTWQQNFGTPDPLQSDGDADGDGSIDGDDLTVWQNQYGPVPMIGAVPEPSSLMVGLSSLLMLALRRRTV